MSNKKENLDSVECTEPAAVRLMRNERGQLELRRYPEADPIAPVRLARCFPWSLRDRYISIRDKEGEELVLLESLDGIEPETRALIEQELDQQEFIPQITAVDNVDDDYEVMAWKVRTDRGPIELQIKSNDDLRQLDDGRVIVKDHAGGKFEVRDLSRLDPRSRRLIEDHLG